MEKIEMTAREFCASRRTKLFGVYKIDRDTPTWRKLGKGYICAVDGSEKNYVASGMVYAVEIYDGKPALYSYTRNDLTGLNATKPYSFKSLMRFVQIPEIWNKRKITFDEMIEDVTRLYPEIKIPDPFAFFVEYGMEYVRDTGEIKNFVGVKNDEE